LKPNSKYDHAFAIIRIDDEDPTGPLGFVVTKVVWGESNAEEETRRLNAGANGYRYINQLTRVERRDSFA